ncbi:nucleoside deaminase [Mycobacterium stomatepiae]|nr:nucleoside deaminase [Mycobacterium stomatepiae]
MQKIVASAEASTRRRFLRLAGIGAGAITAACSGTDGATKASPTTHPVDATAPLDLPYLFDGDPQAQQVARSLLAATPGAEELHRHEQFMRLAIELANNNPSRPFAAVIVDHTSGEVLAQGVNNRSANPTSHGEMVAISDYISRHGNADWDQVSLYSTAEPCVMCCGAIALVGIPRIVWASSIATVLRSDIPQFEISAIEAIARAHQLYRPELALPGVLAAETDKHFAARQR